MLPSLLPLLFVKILICLSLLPECNSLMIIIRPDLTSITPVKSPVSPDYRVNTGRLDSEPLLIQRVV